MSLPPLMLDTGPLAQLVHPCAQRAADQRLRHGGWRQSPREHYGRSLR
jgi:hypothetical protein